MKTIKLLLILLLSVVPAFAQDGIDGGVWRLPRNIATGTGTASASLAAITIYTPAQNGVYELCGGVYVTTAGTTGAVLEAFVTYQNPSSSPFSLGLGQNVTATSIGADSSAVRAQPTCQVFYAAASDPIKFFVSLTGSPSSNPTYTYWYTLARKG